MFSIGQNEGRPAAKDNADDYDDDAFHLAK